MSLFLYRIFLALYRLGIGVASVGSKKARKWLKGRREMPSGDFSGNSIWMHCASLGEFEQGRPVLEGLKEKYPGYQFIVTFFSPSGYEIRKNYAGADHVCYLPMDSPAHARQFLDWARPSLVIWVKYEYWYYYLREIHRRNIPLLLVSAVFRPDQAFFKSYGGFWKKMLGFFSKIFVQNEDSLRLLNSIRLDEKASLSGDTRFDRVSAIAQAGDEIKFIRDFCRNRKVIVAGSTWEEDEDEFVHFIRNNPSIAFIIAPHVTDADNIREVSKRFRNSICYSQLSGQEGELEKNVLIIDNIGILAKLYRYADITYVGGGFGNDGIHNILEAAAYGKPVIIGPVYDRFFEAREMIKAGGCFSIQNALELETLLNRLLQDNEALEKSSAASLEYVRKNRGATAKIMNYVAENRLLIN